MIEQGEKYLVTGATGFLGTLLCRRLINQGCKVRAMARNEGKLVELKQDLPEVEIWTGDVACPSETTMAMRDISGVFHLAAFKHVGMAETQPIECTYSNVMGSVNILENSMNMDFVIGISTDKAVQVSGVYGATKMVMERMFKQYNDNYGGFTRYRIVRYGNVLYSTGSVLCKWRDALQNDKQIVVTDMNATRFFWTVNQALDLIFDCLDNAVNADPYVPDMKAMRVGDLLEAMQMKYGKAKEIKEIGLQPGENMHEKILEDGKYSNEVELYSVDEIYEMV